MTSSPVTVVRKAGHGVVYYVAIGSLLAVLALSANTSFVGFPRLCRLIAADHYLPHAFTIVGRRLVACGRHCCAAGTCARC